MNKRYSIFFKILLIISLNLCILISAIKFTLSFTPLYTFDISYLQIENKSNLNKNTIMNNYTAVISYIKHIDIAELHLPDFEMSNEGKIHFYEVKKIFILLTYINICSTFITLLIFYIFFKYKDFSCLKLSALSLAISPIILILPFLINFDKSFTFIHKLLFNNDYWEFYPDTDPIINILPAGFFFHCILLIVFIMFIFSLTFAIFFLLIEKGHD